LEGNGGYICADFIPVIHRLLGRYWAGLSSISRTMHRLLEWSHTWVTRLEKAKGASRIEKTLTNAGIDFLPAGERGEGVRLTARDSGSENGYPTS
jgi:hypothetical protein